MLTRRQKREEARRLFLTGEADSNAAIARKLRMKARTVARYRKEEDWDELRVKVDRQAAEKLVESLAGERTSLNLRHFRYWDAILAQVGEAMKADVAHGIRELERLTTSSSGSRRGSAWLAASASPGRTKRRSAPRRRPSRARWSMRLSMP